MSMFLRKSDKVSRLCLSAVSARHQSTELKNINGLVLGAYCTEEKGIELTSAAKHFDELTAGKLSDYLQLGGPLKEGSNRTFWGLGQDFQSVVVVGLGKKDKGYNDLENICDDRECVRIAAAAGCKTLESAGATTISVEGFDYPESAAEGAHLGLWKFQEYRAKPKTIPTICFYNSNSGDGQSCWDQGVIKAKGQNTARWLEETPANKMTPTIFGSTVQDLFCNDKNVKVDVHDRNWIEQMKMGSFLSVAAGSCEEPKFVEITYNQGREGDKPFVLVGKGITFDSGGISIKPSAKMEEMRADMGGAACVIGAMCTISQLQLPINVKCLIALSENMPSGTATKPGDVVTAMNGKTIAVDNTDAEGRLVLADALCYSGKFNPKCVMDMATLTGAIGVALGKSAAGVYTNSNDLYSVLEQAGAYTGDRVWRMPLWKMFTKQMTDYTAYDLNNVGKGSGGGSCTAAAFLREFVPEKVDWMHLDIAAVTFPPYEIPYLSGMTGRPTRTVVEFINRHMNK